MKEPRATVAAWVKQIKYTFPVLLDPDGKVSATYAPPGVQPDLARDQVPIASNLIIDKDGNVRFYSLLDSVHFDAKLLALTARLDQLLAAK